MHNFTMSFFFFNSVNGRMCSFHREFQENMCVHSTYNTCKILFIRFWKLSTIYCLPSVATQLVRIVLLAVIWEHIYEVLETWPVCFMFRIIKKIIQKGPFICWRHIFRSKFMVEFVNAYPFFLFKQTFFFIWHKLNF